MLPGYEFHGRMGKWLNLSIVDDREEISTAKLHYFIDVDDDLWCRACRSTECDHTAEIEQVLTIAGLASENDSNPAQHVSFPQIEHITQHHAIRETIAACWFTNGARLRYHESEDSSVIRVVFGPGDPPTPTETTDLPDTENAKEYLIDALTEYCDHRQDGDLDGLREKRPELIPIVGNVDMRVNEH